MTTNEAIRPLDDHNRRLLANAHPGDWVNPSPTEPYNLVVIGAGTAGLVSAAGAAGLGAKTALIESRFFGGECLVDGCVPSKALIRCARATADARRVSTFGVKGVGSPSADFPRVMERMRELRSRISAHDAAARFRDEYDIDVFIGEARFTGPNRIEVDGRELSFSRAIIATGSRPAAPPIEGLAETGYLTNENLFELTRLPRRLGVIGGGPIGCEMAQAFRRLGSEVTLVEVKNQILSFEDPGAVAVLQEQFRDDGVKLMLSARVNRVSKAKGGKRLHLTREEGEKAVEVDEILVGIGRAPVIELGLEAGGVEYDERKGVLVDDHLRSRSNHAVYAAGDVCLRRKFTHTADASARTAIQNALFPVQKRFSSQVIPWCIYTAPEVAHVGMHPADAQEQGIATEKIAQPFTEVDRAILDGEEKGLVIVYLKEGTDTVLGATIVASHAGEMLNELTLAITEGIGLKKLANVIHPYPTQAEAIKKVADTYNRRRLTPGFKKALSKWFSLRR